jgi:Holliday junction resolvase RusA-like endonuclease
VNTVALPIPPSVNNIWRVARIHSGARVTLSKVYRDWLDVAILTLRAGMRRVTLYPVAVRVEIVRGAGWRKGRDADNLLKAISDALVKAGRITDDSEDYVTEFSIRFAERAPQACVRVSVVPVSAAAEARAA